MISLETTACKRFALSPSSCDSILPLFVALRRHAATARRSYFVCSGPINPASAGAPPRYLRHRDSNQRAAGLRFLCLRVGIMCPFEASPYASPRLLSQLSKRALLYSHRRTADARRERALSLMYHCLSRTALPTIGSIFPPWYICSARSTCCASACAEGSPRRSLKGAGRLKGAGAMT